MTLFGHDPLETAGILVVIVSAIVVGWAVWRSKTAEVAAAAVDTWKELAQGYQEKLEQRDTQIAEMKQAHATESATRDAQIEDLRRQIAKLEEELLTRDQTAVLAAVRSHDETMVRFAESLAARADEHERQAQIRRDEQRAEHAEAMGVWQGIREDLRTLSNQT